MANSEDQDEMPRNAAFHQCLHSLVKTGKKYIIWNVLLMTPQYIYNGPS